MTAYTWGKLCTLHPELLGKRYASNRNCPACARQLSKDRHANRSMTLDQEVSTLRAQLRAAGLEMDRLKAESEAYRASVMSAPITELLCCNICRCAIQPANQLKAENEALRKDAVRYRWLRDKSESVHQFYLSTPIWFTGVKFSKANVDATIDAAMAEEAAQ